MVSNKLTLVFVKDSCCHAASSNRFWMQLSLAHAHVQNHKK